MAFDMDPAAEARVLVCAGVQGGRRNEITRVLVNAYDKEDHRYEDTFVARARRS
jgi:hypothetical protein